MSIYRRRLMIANALKKSDSNINYPGLIAAWSAAGKSNDNADRAVLRDLTGNGHDITLNNFAFSEMSGYGGYAIGKNNGWVENSAENKAKFEIYEFSYNKLHIKGPNHVFNSFTGGLGASRAIWESFKVKYTSNNPNIKIIFKYVDENDVIKKGEPLEEGINIIPKSYGRIGGSEWISVFDFKEYNVTDLDFECTIELLPEYPDALVFDGVDDYGINEEMPILTDYTIIAKRIISEDLQDSVAAFISKRTHGLLDGAFWFERTIQNWSFGAGTNIQLNRSLSVSWQTKNKYNGKTIQSGDAEDTNNISIGSGYTNGEAASKCIFYSAYLFDRSLDEQEIKAFIRKYIDADYVLPSEQTTE